MVLYDALAELIDIDFGDKSDDHLYDESFIITTQQMVGGAIPKLKKKVKCEMRFGGDWKYGPDSKKM